MTTMLLTPEAFKAMREPDEDDVVVLPEQSQLYLTEILSRPERIQGLVQAPDQLQAELDRAVGELETVTMQRDIANGLIKQTLETIKKSTSKLANEVRALLDPKPTAEEVTPDAEPEPQPAGEEQPAEFTGVPADDVDVEVWRQWARGRKSAAGHDVNTLNKSQIRSLFGLTHPSAQ